MRKYSDVGSLKLRNAADFLCAVVHTGRFGGRARFGDHAVLVAALRGIRVSDTVRLKARGTTSF